jgi:ribosomal protein S18 acetylase RimI-like enzyme
MSAGTDILLRGVTVDDAEALAHVLITAQDATFRGVVPDQCLEFTEAESTTNWRKLFSEEGVPSGDEFLVVAQTAAGEVVGYVWGGVKDDGSGIVRVLMILPAYHKHGIGRRLVSHVAERLAEKGIHQMSVEVLRENPNRLFYERIGATFVSESPYDWDGVPMSSCLYQWADTRSLLNSSANP